MVLRLLRGEPVDAVSREVGVTIAELEQWRELALAGMEAGLKTRTSDLLQARLDDAVRRVGELSMENEILRKEREQRFNCRQVQYAVGIDRHTAFLARFL